MATELKNATRERTDEAFENTVMSADLLTGAAVTVADNVARVVNHPVREAHKIERRGAEANKQMRRDVAGLVEDAGEKVEAMMPEKVALAGIHAIKARARRKDLVGEFAYRTLQVANRGLEAMLSTVTRLERATKPPARTPSTHARPVARTVRKARRTATSTARSTRSRVRRSTARARRSERASA
jgi:hypothetical protein